MPSVKQQYGSWAERQAEVYLLNKGMKIIDRHVTSRFGEIDILAQDGGVIVAVEVKARRNYKFGRAVEAVTENKLAKVAAALQTIVQRRGLENKPLRIDVVTIEPSGIDYVVGVGPAEN